jgi:GT2 family glycosyltransferase
MNPVAIIIPTLDEAHGKRTGKLATLSAACQTRLIVVAGPKRGFTKTVNDGLRQLEPGEDVCILNDDVTGFQHGWLATLQRALYSNAKYGIVGPSGKSAAISRTGTRHDSGLQKCEQLSFWCVVIKRAVIDKIGILDERFIHYASDNEYCMRAIKKGWQIIWVKDVFLKHVGHGSGLQTKWKQQDHHELNRYLKRGK